METLSSLTVPNVVMLTTFDAAIYVCVVGIRDNLHYTLYTYNYGPIASYFHAIMHHNWAGSDPILADHVLLQGIYWA